MGGNPSPRQPCHAVLSLPNQPFHACAQFATPLLLLEFSPGDLGAPSVFGLSVFLFKVTHAAVAASQPATAVAQPTATVTLDAHPVATATDGPPHTCAAAKPLTVDPSYPRGSLSSGRCAAAGWTARLAGS